MLVGDGFLQNETLGCCGVTLKETFQVAAPEVGAQ